MGKTDFPPAAFTPTLLGYTGQGAFRYWCQTALPLVYDDSLSYYELLNKVVVYLNNVISDVSNTETNVESLLTAYNQLQEYVNTYFNGIDIQDEINNRLDEMAANGTLTSLISPFIPDLVSTWLSENVTPTTPLIDKTLSIDGAGADAKVVGNVFSGLEDYFDLVIGNDFDNDWIMDFSYSAGSSVTNLQPGDYSASPGYACKSISCTPGQVFYLTGTGGSGSKLWIWTKSDGTIIERSASNAIGNNLKLTAPSEAAYLMVDVKTTLPFYIVPGIALNLRKNNFSYMGHNVEFVHDDSYTGSFTLLDNIMVICGGALYTITPEDVTNAASGSSIVTVDGNTFSGTNFSLIFNTDTCKVEFVAAGVAGYESMAKYPVLYYHRYDSSTGGLLIEYQLTRDIIKKANKTELHPLAYVGNGKEFVYSDSTTGSFTIDNTENIYVVCDGTQYEITPTEIINAATASSYVSVNNNTVSGQSFIMYYNTDTNVVEFVGADPIGYDYANSYPCLFYHRFASITAGLLVEYANRKNIIKNDKNRFPIAYIGNGKDFIYSDATTGYFTLDENENVCIVANGVLYNIAPADIIAAASGLSYLTVDGYTVSGQSFVMYFDTDDRVVKFSQANSSGYPLANKYPTLFYHRYSSVTCGLLVDYANRKQKPGDLPVYFENEAQDCKDKIIAAQTSASLVIGVATDSHYGCSYPNNWDDTYATLKRVNELVHFDMFFHLGDMVHGDDPKAETITQLNLMKHNMESINPDVHLLSGNHDNNYFYYDSTGKTNGLLTKQEKYSIYAYQKDADGRLANTSCFYKDIEQLNLRVIGLDGTMGDNYYATNSAWGYTDEVINWVRDTALNTSKHVVFFSHVPCTTEYDYGGSSGGVVVVNGVNLRTIIENFISNGGIVVGFFHGHTHWDFIGQYNQTNGFKEVSIGRARYDTMTTESFTYVVPGAICYAKTRDTVTQELWDTIIIKPSERKVEMVRFGAGVDRSFTY